MNLTEQKSTSFFLSDRGLMLLLWLLALGLRVAYTLWDGLVDSVINPDAYNYLAAGMEFARTGQITHDGFPTAQVMPGMPVLIGLLGLFVRERQALKLACRILWILLGSCTPLFYYKSVRLFTSRIWAFLAGCVCLLPNLVQIDCFLVTEGPYYLFFAMALYYTPKMGQDPAFRYIWRYALSVLGALMFRANILSFLPFTLLYLLLCGYGWKELLRRALAVCLVLALFIVPWSIRNYRIFHAFIPISYGSGSPLLEGSYQGPYAISDEALAEAFGPYSAEEEVRQTHPELFDAEGTLLEPQLGQYYRLLLDDAGARHRIFCWLRLDPGSFFKSILFRLRYSLNYVWYYSEPLGITWGMMHRLRQLNLLFCLLSLALAFLLKRHRKVMAFLALAWTVNFVIVSATYAGDRYAQMLMAYRYVGAGIGMDLAAEALRRLHGGKRKGVV